MPETRVPMIGAAWTTAAKRGGACFTALVLLWAWAAPPAPAAGQEAAAEPAAWDAERAFVALERLETEIGLLRGLAAAQAALLAWNGERADSGAGPAVLPAALCADERLAAWCRALPATFGAGDPGAGERPGAETAAIAGGGQGERRER